MRWPEVELAHPLDDGTAVVLERSVAETAAALGTDGPAYRHLVEPLVDDWHELLRGVLRPLRVPTRSPLLLARFGAVALFPCARFVRARFREEPARALLAGIAAHAQLPLDAAGTMAFALMLLVAGHARGWPIVRGGSQRIADALGGYLGALGGSVETGRRVESLDELHDARAIVFDLTPAPFLRLARRALPGSYTSQLDAYRPGCGVFKLDWALRGPIPWTAAACHRTATVHLGGRLEELEASEAAVEAGRAPEKPFVILVQPTLYDPSRAPPEQHTAWAYCHVPNGSRVDMTERIEAQIERFAPGFRARVLARHVLDPASIEARNPNLAGGDIGGGANRLLQVIARPAWRWDPYSTPDPRLFLCSSATPPGGGVHGMCGYWAARSVLRTLGA